MNSSEPELLQAPGGAEQVLLHACCAVCACAIIDVLQAADITPSLFFYNPNIHPRDEYDLRKKEVMRYAEKRGVACADGDYETEEWFERIRGLEDEPERGKRCALCFDLRLERTALYAVENQIPLMATTLGISRWKNLSQVNEAGANAASRYPEVEFWSMNWRQDGGTGANDGDLA